MTQQQFADNVVRIISKDPTVIGLAAAGSWVSEELDEYSDLDLVLITTEKVNTKEKMISYAEQYGKLLAAFTGEHVGESRLLICLYDEPLLHVDIKFLVADEFRTRVENPTILFERNGTLSSIIKETKAVWPQPDPQWIEDRFWIWVHYVAGKVGRGELLETISSLDFLRVHVLSPLMYLKNNQNNRAMRKAETKLQPDQSRKLINTIAKHDAASVLTALDHAIDAYLSLRKELFKGTIRASAEEKSLRYLSEIKKRKGLV